MERNLTQVIPIPYVLILLSLIPLILVANFLPAHADTRGYLLVDDFLNKYLFGTVGFWSSFFPFSSKFSANYISIFGPVFSGMAIYITRAKIIIDPEQYRGLTLKKYVFAMFVLIVLLMIFISINYFEAIDLAGHNLRFRIFGLNAFMFSIFASAMFLCYYAVALCAYVACYYIPRLLMRRWKNINI